MFRKITQLMMLALAAGALLPAGSVRANPAVPFKDHGQMTIVANLSGFPIVTAVDQATGEATHLGQYSNAAYVTVNFITGLVSGEGQYTAANGDTLNYTVVQPLQPPNTPAVVTFNGGTGRFADATGSATASASNVTTVQQGSLLIITQDLTTVGTISY
jgi:hypothetical protein